VLTTAKHFPGHGDTSVDSHLQTPTLTHDRKRFNSIEFPPFINAISAGVDAVMSAHIFVPELDPQNIATLSPRILTDILRKEMGFEGIITTDALIMSGVADLDSSEAIAVQAVKAGADILLMPIDPIATIDAVCRAVEMGEISRDRIRESVQRIWTAKQKVCGTHTNLGKLGNPANLEIAKEIAINATSIYSTISNLPFGKDLKNNGKDNNYLNLIIVDDPLACHEFLNGRSPTVLLPHSYGYQRMVADGLTLGNLQCDRYSQVLIQIFSRGNPFRGNTNLHQQTLILGQKLLAERRLQAVVVYGSPYTLDQLLPILPSQIPWGFAYSQQPEAQTAILQKLGFE
jgi:beta-glucosidase